MRVEPEIVVYRRTRGGRGRWVEVQMREASDAVAPLVSEPDAIRRHVGLEVPASPGRARAAHLEDIGIVSREPPGENQCDPVASMVRDDELLVQHGAPEEFCQLEMNRRLRQPQ